MDIEAVAISWGLGLLLSMGVGHHVVRRAGRWLIARIATLSAGWPEACDARYMTEAFPGIMGHVERGFFTVIVGCHVQGAATIAGPLLIVKLAIGWTGLAMLKDNPTTRMYAQRALMLSLLSIGFGLAGGAVAGSDVGAWVMSRLRG